MHKPSSHRPIPLVRRSDLQISRMSFDGEEHIVVKDPLGLRYFQIPSLQYQVLDALNGYRSLNEIRSLIMENRVANDVSPAEVFRLIMDLARKRLIWSQRKGTSKYQLSHANDTAWRGIWAFVNNPFFIRLPGLYPGQSLNQLSRYLGWIYSKTVVAAVATFIIGSWLLLLLHLDTFLVDLPTVSGLLTGQGFWTLWVVVGMLKVVHELSHGLACERFGAECHSVGLAFLFFSPCMYCDVTDAWMLKRKMHRVAISMAGVYVELFISSLGLWMWWFSAPGLFHQVCLQVFLAGSVATLLLNANPLLRFDGYYVLADLLEIPNLYQRSRQAIQRLASRILLGIRIPDDHLASGKRSSLIIIMYGLASMTYQLPMLVGLGFFVYGILEPIGLTAVGWIYLLARLTIVFKRLTTWSIRMGQRQKYPARTLARSLVVATIGALTLIGFWFCPLPNSITAPIVIEPQLVQPVYVETPGRVCSVLVQEGDAVKPGTLLAELENFELDRRIVELNGTLAAFEMDFRMAQAIGDPDLTVLAETAIKSTTSQIEHAQVEKDRLQLRAPIAGTLITANKIDGDYERIHGETIEESSGLLNSRLIGRHLPRRSCLCQIAPSQFWQASLLIDQRNRQHLSMGQRVETRVDSFSGNVIVGKVVSIGSANETEIPSVLSTKYGGQLITQTGSSGEQPGEPIYRATLLLEDSHLPMKSDMQGTGRFAGPKMTIGSWLTDEFHRLFFAR